MSEKQYSPACRYWNCLNHVKVSGKFCSRYCMEEFVENPPPWVDTEEWSKGIYKDLVVEQEKKRIACHWCGGMTYIFHKGRKRLPKCGKCKIRLCELYTKSNARPKSPIQKCKSCHQYCNTYWKGKLRPPYCSSCVDLGKI